MEKSRREYPDIAPAGPETDAGIVVLAALLGNRPGVLVQVLAGAPALDDPRRVRPSHVEPAQPLVAHHAGLVYQVAVWDSFEAVHLAQQVPLVHQRGEPGPRPLHEGSSLVSALGVNGYR